MTRELANRYISVLYRYGRRFFAQKIREQGLEIEVGQLPFLIQSYRFPGISQDTISTNLGMDKGTTARSMKQLELLGYVRRVPDADDRRINQIYPTDKARAIEPQMFALIAGLNEVLYAGFTPAESAAADQILLRMKQNLEKEISL